MHEPSTSFLTLSLLSTGLLACASDAPTPSEVRARIASDLTNVLRETAAAADGALDEVPGAGALALLDGALGDRSDSLRLVRETAERFLPTASGASARRAAVVPLEPDEEGGFDPAAIAQTLNLTIFTDANHVGDGVFALPVELGCATTIVDDLGDVTDTLDPECVEQWEVIQPRIRVAEDGDALRFAVQLGAAHDEPLELALSPRSLALSIDLDEAEDAGKVLATALGAEAPNLRLDGRITGALEVLGAAHVEAKLTIDRALGIAIAEEGVDLDGPEAMKLTSAAGTIFAVELDGPARDGAFEIGLGATTLHTPGDDGFGFDLAGVTARAELAAGQPLKLTNISLGRRTAYTYRGQQIAQSIDLNPDDDGTLAATITTDPATGLDTLTVSPELDLRMFVDHDVLGEQPPVYDVDRVLLDGSLRTGAAGEQVEVLSGTFSVSTTPASYGFSAGAGECVSAFDAYDDTSGSYYTAFAVGACP